MVILILGQPPDPHVVQIQQALIQAGAEVHVLDSQLFPQQVQLSWSPAGSISTLTLGGDRLDIARIHSGFWRNFAGVKPPPLTHTTMAEVAHQDSMSLMRSVLQIESIHWVNPWRAYEFHKEKPRQLQAVNRLGVPIPATLVSNAPADIIMFANQHAELIFKPVYGGAHCQRLTPDHLTPERLSLSLKIAPATFQEYIPGTNIRTYCIGQKIYAVEFQSGCLDFRDDATLNIQTIDLPEVIQHQCWAIQELLFLEWTAIDWRRTPEGKYVFLEANPSPMFLYVEQQTGFPITDQLVKLLMAS